MFSLLKQAVQDLGCAPLALPEHHFVHLLIQGLGFGVWGLGLEVGGLGLGV